MMWKIRWGFTVVHARQPIQLLKFLGPLLVALFFLLASVSFAQNLPQAWGNSAKENDEDINTNPLEAAASFQPSVVEAGGTTRLRIKLKLAEHYHAYLDRFKLLVESPEGLKLDTFKITPVVEFFDSVSKEKKQGVEKSAELVTTVEVPLKFAPQDSTVQLRLTYQACTKDHCLFPKTITLLAPLQITDGSTNLLPSQSLPQLKAAPDKIPSSASDFELALSRGIIPALLFVFIIGFLTSLTPCVYPMIPITLAVLGTRTQGQSRLKSFLLAVVYVHGIATTYSILGVLAASTGSLFGSALSNIWVVSAIALLFVIMGLSMFGLFEIQVPGFIRNRMGGGRSEKSGFVGAYLTGLVAGIVASPCIGPVLVSILAYIAQSQNRGLGFLLLFTFAMGMGVLFIVLGTFSSLLNRVPKSGPWMDLVKFIFGTTMIGMALYYVQPLYPSWLFYLLMGLAMVLLGSAFGAFDTVEKLHANAKGRLRKGTMLALFTLGVVYLLLGSLELLGVRLAQTGSAAVGEINFQKLNWQPYSDAALAQAKADGKPVVIDFYADWCVACKELEKFTFTDPKVRTLSEKFVLLKYDATEESAELTILKKRYTVLGLPTLLLFSPSGQLQTDLTLTGFENAEAFQRRLESAMSR